MPVELTEEMISRLPVEFSTDQLRGTLQLAEPVGLAVTLALPFSEVERGARPQEQLQQRLIRRLPSPDKESGAVLFRSYFGETCSCNPLAVHQELRRRDSGHTLYWGVRDHSVAVPDGGVPVIHESAEWYRLLHEAEYYMDNMHQPIYHRKPAHQVQIQTFHGYPFKQMGRSHWAWQNRDAAHVRSYLERAADWDYLVSPATYGTEALVEEFGFPNEVLEIGYPRNDVLQSDRAEDVRARVRANFGIRPDQQVVLYAPTFRDHLAQNDFRAAMVDFLDTPQLSAELGPDWVIMVRGHAFNARVASRLGSHGSVLDVTDYPDINDLCLASDVAVLDYSSLRFDYALTGKPMLFMVPDLKLWSESSRGTLFDYPPTAPGPDAGQHHRGRRSPAGSGRRSGPTTPRPMRPSAPPSATWTTATPPNAWSTGSSTTEWSGSRAGRSAGARRAAGRRHAASRWPSSNGLNFGRPGPVALGVLGRYAVDGAPDLVGHRRGAGHQRTGCELAEIEIGAPQSLGVVIQIGDEEDQRLAGDGEVEHRRGVVGDHHLGDGEQIGDLGVPGHVDHPVRPQRRTATHGVGVAADEDPPSRPEPSA